MTNKTHGTRQSNARAPQKFKSNVSDKGGGVKIKKTNTNYSDVKKTMDRGPREFKSRASDKEGEIMEIAQRNVITTYPTTPVKDVSGLMSKHDFRRIPVTDPGTGRLEGMALAMDILDFLGGGEKYNIILNEYGGNFLSAINCHIRRIMFENYSFLDRQASFDDVVEIILKKHHSAIPVVDNENKLAGIVTERDILPTAENLGISVGDVMHDDIITSSRGMMISDVSKIMVRGRKRRLPVIENDRLIGIVTVFDVLRFLGRGEFKGTIAEDVLSTRVEDIMTADIKSVSSEQDVSDVLNLIDETGIGGFPVVENNELIGIITITDIIREIYG